jgi:hypothetical protein
MMATLWHIFLMLSFVFVCGCCALGVLKAAEIIDAELARHIPTANSVAVSERRTDEPRRSFPLRETIL